MLRYVLVCMLYISKQMSDMLSLYSLPQFCSLTGLDRLLPICGVCRPVGILKEMVENILLSSKYFGFLIEVTDVQICTTNNLFS